MLIRIPSIALCALALISISSAPFAHGETVAAAKAAATDITAGLKLVDEIDPAKVQPEYESTPGASQVANLLGREARVMEQISGLFHL